MKIRIPNDISKYKPKDIGNFSLLECAYIAIAAICVIIGWKVFGKMEYGLPFAGVVLVFGFFKPFKMSFMQFLKTAVKEMTSQRIYLYETDFDIDKDVEEDEVLYGEEYCYQSGETLTPRPVKISSKDKQEFI